MSQAYDDLIFASQVLNTAKRVIVCNPELESRLKTRLQVQGLAGVFEVRPDPNCPLDRTFVIDENAIAAASAESLQHGRWRWWWRLGDTPPTSPGS